ncbi:MAG: enoyl-CoA hydratase/isomerase family protein [Rhodospirillaceae bacterium]|nr:enoyl-CoA hydratase/isomerase family protein [Rhodospirillaceae bacterium]
MSFTNLDFAVDGEIGVLTLKRPDVLNALDIATARELRFFSETMRNTSPVRALIVTGAGRAFSAGGDLSSVKLGLDGREARSLEITSELHAVMLNFARMDAPVIAAVNGIAAGAGFALACACDIIIAASSAKFMAAYTLAGLCPDLGLTYTLPRLVGAGVAKSLILTNRMVLAPEAKIMGLVADVVADDQLLPTAKGIGAEILKGSSAAIGVTKQLLETSHSATFEAQLARESKSLAALSATDESFQRCLKFVK